MSTKGGRPPPRAGADVVANQMLSHHLACHPAAL